MCFQGGDKELTDYSLHELAGRHLGGMPAGTAAAAATSPGAATAGPSVTALAGGGGAAAAIGATPLQRMRRALEAAVALGEALHVRLAEAQLPVEAMQREMQVGQPVLAALCLALDSCVVCCPLHSACCCCCVHVPMCHYCVPSPPLPPPLQVAALLAQMEVAGLGFDPWLLGQAGQLARSHMARIEDESASVAGRPFNLSSPQQLAEVLYRVLKVGQQ